MSALTCALDFSAIVRGREPCTGDLFAMTHRHPFDGVLGGALCMQHREAFKPGVLIWISDTPLFPPSTSIEGSPESTKSTAETIR